MYYLPKKFIFIYKLPDYHDFLTEIIRKITRKCIHILHRSIMPSEKEQTRHGIMHKKTLSIPASPAGPGIYPDPPTDAAKGSLIFCCHDRLFTFDSDGSA